jgi:hypothetical protein
MEDLENRMVPWRGVSTQGKLGIYSSERRWTASSCLQAPKIGKRQQVQNTIIVVRVRHAYQAKLDRDGPRSVPIASAITVG